MKKGIKERISETENLEKVYELLTELGSYEYVSRRTLSKVDRIVRQKEKIDIQRVNKLMGSLKNEQN